MSRARAGAAIAVLSVICALLVATGGAAAVVAPASVARAAAVRTGTVAVTIRTPRGVPGTVVLTSSGRKRVVTKRPPGTSSIVKVKLPPGVWKVAPQRVVTSSAVYGGVASPSSVRVRAGRQVAVAVTYRAAPTVRSLVVTRVEPTRVDLSWTQPAAGASYTVRRATGTVAPVSVTAGAGVPVMGTTAAATGLIEGTDYAFAVFARAKGSTEWGRAVAIRASTPSSELPAVVTNPATVRVDSPSASTVTLSEAGVVATVPAGTVPTVGQPWVLPPSDTLPGGFIGKVTSVSSDGGAVTLAAAGILDAFDYVEVRVPDISSLPVTTLAGRPYGARGSRAAPDDVDLECEGTAEASLTVNRQFAPFGSFDATMVKDSFLGVDYPVGVTFDGTFGVSAGVSVDASLTASASCVLDDLPALKVTLPAGPVPLALVVEPVVTVSASGELSVRAVGASVRLGVAFDGHVGAGDDDHINGSLIKEANVHTPQVTKAEALLSVQAGVDVSVGPGVGNSAIGAMAGVTANLRALDATLQPMGLDCVELRAAATASGSVSAKAWLGDLSIEKSLTIPGLDDASIAYPGSPWYFPQGCGGPAEYRILSGTLDVTGSWSGGCANDQGWCNDGPDHATTVTFGESSSAKLTVAEPGPWALQGGGDDEAYLEAPMRFSSWAYDAHQIHRYSGFGCSSTHRYETTGPVEFGDAYWATGAWVKPAPGAGLDADLAHYWGWHDEIPDGEWTTDGWWGGGGGAWDTDYSNEFPRVPTRDTTTYGGDCEGTHTDEGHMNLQWLGRGSHFTWSPEQSRRTSNDVTITPQEGCVPEACQFRVTGTQQWEYRSDTADNGVNGTGTTTTTWSYLIERRPPSTA